MKVISHNPDTIGMLASSLCLLHCLATPFLFLAKACSSTCCADAPLWWQIIDFVFIVISFIAIYYATKNTSKSWIQIALWGSWFLLLATIISEYITSGLLPANFVYVPSIGIVVLHFYNQKYCKCTEKNCCIDK